MRLFTKLVVVTAAAADVRCLSIMRLMLMAVVLLLRLRQVVVAVTTRCLLLRNVPILARLLHFMPEFLCLEGFEFLIQIWITIIFILSA